MAQPIPASRPSDAIVYLSASIPIAAPAPFVYAILADTRTWPAWNPLVPSCALLYDSETAEESISEPQPGAFVKGARMRMQVKMTPDAAVREQKGRVTAADTIPAAGDDGAGGYKVCWAAEGMPGWALRTNRESEVVQRASDGGCEFRTWEAMSGVLARVVKVMYEGTLQARFEDTADALKAYAEKEWAERKDESQA